MLTEFRVSDFCSSPSPPSIEVHTWYSCTLYELALELADARPGAFPSPAVGTRLVFQLISPEDDDSDNEGSSRARFSAKDLGSVVIGEGGPGAEVENDPATERRERELPRTLDEARFLEGDYISCAILAPMPDGSVAHASLAKVNVGSTRSRHRQNQANHFGPGRRPKGTRSPPYSGNTVPMGDWDRDSNMDYGDRGSNSRDRW